MTDVVGENIFPALISSGCVDIFFFDDKKFRINGMRVTLIPGDQFPFPGLVGIFGVIGAGGYRLCDGFTLVDMERPDPCSCQK